MPRIAAIAASALPSWINPMIAFASTTATVTIALAQGTATRSLGSWQVTSYSESLPADGLVTGEAGLIGSAIWTTTYST